MIGMSWDKILKVIQVPNVNLDIEDKPPEYEEPDGPCKKWFEQFVTDMQFIDRVSPNYAFQLSGTLTNEYEENTKKLKTFIDTAPESVFCKIKEYVEYIKMDDNIIYEGGGSSGREAMIDGRYKIRLYLEKWKILREYNPRATVDCHCTIQVLDTKLMGYRSIFTLEFFTGNPFEEWMTWKGVGGPHEYDSGLLKFLEYFGSNDGGKSFRKWAVWYHLMWKEGEG